MSNMHNQNSGGIPVFLRKDFIGYLVCNCKPWQGYWTLHVQMPLTVAQHVDDANTEPLTQVAFRFHKSRAIRNGNQYTCWLAEVYSGEEYISMLRKDQFIFLAEVHGWIDQRELA